MDIKLFLNIDLNESDPNKAVRLYSEKGTTVGIGRVVVKTGDDLFGGYQSYTIEVTNLKELALSLRRQNEKSNK